MDKGNAHRFNFNFRMARGQSSYILHALGKSNIRSFVTIPRRGEKLMADVSSILKQLKNERDRVAKQLSGMDAALRAFADVHGGPETMTHEKEDYASPRVSSDCLSGVGHRKPVLYSTYCGCGSILFLMTPDFAQRPIGMLVV